MGRWAGGGAVGEVVAEGYAGEVGVFMWAGGSCRNDTNLPEFRLFVEGPFCISDQEMRFFSVKVDLIFHALLGIYSGIYA